MPASLWNLLRSHAFQHWRQLHVAFQAFQLHPTWPALTRLLVIPRRVGQVWEEIAARAYAADGVLEGWDSEDEKENKRTAEEKFIEVRPSSSFLVFNHCLLFSLSLSCIYRRTTRRRKRQ